MNPDTNAREIHIKVADYPPRKNGANSIFNSEHPDHDRVVKLLQKAKHALTSSRWNPQERAPIDLELIVNGVSGDLDNNLGGVADVLKASRTNNSPHLADLAETSLYDDDNQIEELRCSVGRGDTLSYSVRVWVLR